MQLKIFKGKSVFELFIKLEDGYILKFQDAKEDFTRPVKTLTNLWFKVNVLDILVIQCDNKVIKWKAKNDDNIQTIKAFENDSNNVKCPELVSFFTELDEILKSIKKGNIVDSIKIQLLITLKTHVLQIIFLCPKHIPLIRKEFEKQKTSLFKVEENIPLKHDLMVKSRNEIKKWLKQFLKGTDVNNQPLQLLLTLSERADDIISELFIDLNQKQEELLNSTELNKYDDIKFYQNIRDELISDLQQWLDIRIHSWTAYKKSKNKKSAKFNNNSVTFQNLCKDYDNSLRMLNEIKMAPSKIKIIEDAIKCFLFELQNVIESKNINLLIRTDSENKCENLYEEIGSILSNKSSPLRKLMREFTGLFKQKCCKIENDFSLVQIKLKPNAIEASIPTPNYTSNNNNNKINVIKHKTENMSLTTDVDSLQVSSLQCSENYSKFSSINYDERSTKDFLMRNSMKQPWSLPIMKNIKRNHLSARCSKERIEEIYKEINCLLERSSLLFYSSSLRHVNNERKYSSLTTSDPYLNKSSKQQHQIVNKVNESKFRSNGSEERQILKKQLSVIVDEYELTDKLNREMNCNVLKNTGSDNKSQILNKNSKQHEKAMIQKSLGSSKSSSTNQNATSSRTSDIVLYKTDIDEIDSTDNVYINFDNFQLLQDLVNILSNHINVTYLEFNKYTSLDLTQIIDVYSYFCDYYESQIYPPIYKNIVSLYTTIFKNVCDKIETSFRNLSTGIEFLSIFNEFCTDPNHNHMDSIERNSSRCNSFETYFASTYQELEAVINSHSLLNTMKLLTNAVQTLYEQLAIKNKKPVGADEMIPILELVLFHMLPHKYCSLFIITKILNDFVVNIIPDENRHDESQYILYTFVGLFDLHLNTINIHNFFFQS